MSMTGNASAGNTTLFQTSTTTPLPVNVTLSPEHEVKQFHRTLSILFIPISLIAIFCILSGVVYYLLKRRRLDQLRHHLVPLYNFDPGEGDDWEAEVLEPSVDLKQKRNHDYKTMDGQTATSLRL